MSSKEILVNEILKEINEVPVIYLKTLYALIHSFKETIPIPEKTLNNEMETNFDWDELLNEIHSNRDKNNILLSKKVLI